MSPPRKLPSTEELLLELGRNIEAVANGEVERIDRGGGYLSVRFPRTQFQDSSPRRLESMSRQSFRSDFEILGEAAVYPGHSVTTGLLIMEAYDSFEDASRLDKHNCPDAVSNGAIPGAGGSVHAALAFLEFVITERLSLDEAIDLADKNWASVDGQKADTTSKYRLHDRWRQGQDQADKLKERVRKKLLIWK